MHEAMNFSRPVRRSLLRVLVIPILLLMTMPAALFAATPPGARSGSGKIALATQPPGATIFLDGQASGKTPGVVDGLAAGRYFVRLELDGYRPAELVVELSSGQSYQLPAIALISNAAPRPVETPRGSSPAVAVTKPAPVVPATPVPASVRAIPVATPVPMPAAPAPAPVTVASPPAPAPAAASGDEDEKIRALVAAHLKAIADGDIAAYLKLCAPKVDLYDEGVQGHETIRKTRQKLKERWPVYEITNVRDLTVRAADQPDVRRAAVTYDWNVSNPNTGKKANGTANDLVDFKQVGSEWLIVKTRQNVDRKQSRSQ